MRTKTPEYLDDLISILNASNQRAVHPAGGEDHLALTLVPGSDPLITLNYATQELALGDVTAQSDFTAHTANANAHHAAATAGDGINVTGQQIAVDSTVVRTSRLITAGTGLSGGGSLAADRTIDINYGDGLGIAVGDQLYVDMDALVNTNQGLQVVSNDVGIKLASPSGLTFNGSTGGLELTAAVAGAGLTLTSQVLTIGAGDGLDVTANSIVVDVTDLIGVGLDEDGSNNLVLGTPSALTVSTTNNVSGTTHTHAITASSNPGASSSLLKSDASGDLTLVNMTLSGNLAVNGGNITAAGDLTIAPGAINFLKIDGYLRSANYVADMTGWAITDDTGIAEFRSITADAGIISGALDVGQDFTVGTNILFVDQSQSNVGINCAPDGQFALDINGNVRWQGYGVGQMALQIPDAIMICHFDGPRPYESDFTGTLTGHMGQIGTASGGVIFRPGMFGKSVQICGAATNFVDNPSFEVNLTHWFTRSGNTLSRVTTRSRYGSACAEVTVGTPSDGLLLWNGTSTVLSNAGTHVITAWIWVPSDWDGGNVAALPVNWTGSVVTSFDVVWTAGSDPYETWFRVQTTFTADAGDLAGGACIYTASLPTSGRKIYADAYQTTEGSIPTMYLDGSLGDGHSWSGTAHLSSSMRTAASLSYDDIVPKTSSVSLWWNPANDAANQPTGYLWAAGTWECFWDASDKKIHFTEGYSTEISTSVLSFSAGDWIHVATTFAEYNDMNIYINGVLDANGTPGQVDTGTLYIGNSGGYTHCNGLIDDLLVVDRVMDAAEIRAIYESHAPVFAETSTWSFNLPNNLVWADSEGLWVRDEAGNAVFGVIGVDGKSWAGISNDAGDLVIGNSSSHYIRWDASTGVIAIAANGGGVTNINGGNIQTGTVTATQIAANTITATEIAANTITATQIAANTITATEIAANTITATEIAADAITASEIAAGALDAFVITGATMRTAASGARVEMNSTKIFGTDGTTTQWQALASSGKISAGAGGVEIGADGIVVIDSRKLSFKEGATVIGEIGVTEPGNVRLMTTGGVAATSVADHDLAEGTEWNEAGSGSASYNQTYQSRTCGSYAMTYGGAGDSVAWYSDWITVTDHGAIIQFSYAMDTTADNGSSCFVEWNAGSADFEVAIDKLETTWHYYEVFAEKPSGATAVRLRFYESGIGFGSLYLIHVTDFDILSYADGYSLLDVRSSGIATIQAENQINLIAPVTSVADQLLLTGGYVRLEDRYLTDTPAETSGVTVDQMLYRTGASGTFIVYKYSYFGSTVYYKYMRLDTTGTPTWTHATSLPSP